jgi:hypothetical protein
MAGRSAAPRPLLTAKTFGNASRLASAPTRDH